jgi:maltodextrin utilization protein YvdJ
MVAMERRTVAATVETTPGAKKQPWYSRYRDAVSLLLAIGVFVAVLNVEIFVVSMGSQLFLILECAPSHAVKARSTANCKHADAAPIF